MAQIPAFMRRPPTWQQQPQEQERYRYSDPPIEVTTIRLIWPEGEAAIREGLAALLQSSHEEVNEMAQIDDDIANLTAALRDNDSARDSVLQAFQTVNQLYITALQEARNAGVPPGALAALEAAVAKVQANAHTLADAAVANTAAAQQATSVSGGADTTGGGANTTGGGPSTVTGTGDTRPPFDPNDPNNPNNQPNPNTQVPPATLSGGANTVAGGANTVAGAAPTP